MPGDWTVLDVIDYLVQEESSLTAEDLSSLRSSKIFRRECWQGDGQEDTRHCAAELYPPLDVFRKLRLPVLEWSGKSGWTETSPEGELNVIYISFKFHPIIFSSSPTLVPPRFESIPISTKDRGPLLLQRCWGPRDRVRVFVQLSFLTVSEVQTGRLL